MTPFAVLRLLHVPFWRRAPLAILLPVLGVAVGVGAIVAVDLGGAGAVGSFRRTLDRLEGRATHVAAGERVPNQLARRLASVPGVEVAAPVVEAVALHGGEPVRLLGLDPLAERGLRSLGLDRALAATGRDAAAGDDATAAAEDATAAAEAGDDGTAAAADRVRELVGVPGALVVSAGFLDRHGLRPGDRLPLVIGARRVEALVLGALPREADGLEVPDDLAVGDVATVQELSGRVSGVDRVELRISAAGGARALAAVSQALPAGVRLERAGSRSEELERALSAFRANLRALSFLALFVGVFLIYNGVLLSVLRRRDVLGVARCLGATRGQVLGAWMLEALLVGVAGTAAGLALGAAFAAPALREVAGTARSLYGAVGTASVRLDAGILARGAAVGLAFTLASALVPALEAANTAPAHTSSRSGVERRSRARRRGALAAAVPLLAVAAAALAWPSTSAAPGYVAAAALALGAALVVPAALDLLLRLLLASGFAGPGGVVRLAAAGLRGSLSRTGVAVAALTVALAMSVAMGALVGSFRGELVRWIEGSVRADVYVSPAALEVDREGAALPADLQSTLAALPGAAEVTSYRERPVRVLPGGGAGRAPIDTHLAAVDVAVLRRRADWPVMDGLDPAAFFDGLAAGGAGVSEPLHRRTGLSRGDSVRVLLGGRVHALPVAGVYREYGSETGLVLVDRAAFRGTPELGPPRSLGVFLRPGADPDAFAETVRRGARGLALTVRTRDELRARALSVFDRTFAITRALEVAALCVAAVGILGALLSILLERGRELAVLRALGATRGQLAGTFFVESTVLASLAWLFALAAGAALAWILIAVVNVRSFGWALPYRVPLGAWSTALLASLLASWAATLWPARRVARLPVAALLRDE